MKQKIYSLPKALLSVPVVLAFIGGTSFALLRPQVEVAAKANDASAAAGAASVQLTQAVERAAKVTAVKVQTSSVKKQQEQAKATEAAKTQATASSSPKAYPAISAPSPKGKQLYVTHALTGRPQQIANQPTATWFGGWTPNVTSAANSLVTAAASQGKIATIVAYNIPARDCGSYSAGGAGSSSAYRAWIRGIAAGIGNRQAIVILEPDALAQITCLNGADQAARYADLSDAVNVLATQTRASVYLDAGHSAWVDAATMASRLQKANIGQARGFSLNVSNFQTTASNVMFGNALAAKTGKSYVIDTSRNGRGSNGEWCNPRGRALGERPTTATGGAADAYLWIKQPGESDGNCNGGPAAGVWWQEYAEELIRNAGY